LLLVVLVGCDTASLRTVSERLEVPGEALVFEDTFLGQQREQRLPLVNAGRRARRVRLLVESGAFAVPAELELGPWERRELSVRFAPARAGEVSAVLRVQGDGEAVEVRLQGTGRELPVCSSARTCHAMRLDPERGVCWEERLPEGSACETPCLEGGRCVEGECLGLGASCDDGDACTADACAPEAGCLHTPIALPDAPPDQPCLRATCDATEGVRWETVEDGTPCGAWTCGGAHVCIAGACTVRAPAGNVCGEACGERLRCDSGACVTSQGALAPVWRYPRPPGKSLHFPGLVDTQGNLYWFEYDSVYSQRPSCELVSVTREGKPRYRHPAEARVCGDTWNNRAVIVGEFLVLGGEAVVSWHRLSDGEVSWRVERARVLASDSTETLPIGMVHTLAAGGSGTLYALVYLGNAYGLGHSAVVAMEPRSREVKQLLALWNRKPWGLRLDEEENLYVTSESLSAPWEDLGLPVVASYSATGAERWRGAPAGPLFSAWGGRVWNSYGRVLDAHTGALLFEFNAPDWSLGQYGPVGVDDTLFAWSWAERCVGAGCPPKGLRWPALVGLDGRTGEAKWHVALPMHASGLLLTESGGVLFTAGSTHYSGHEDPVVDFVETRLMEVSASGQVLGQRRLCEQELLLQPLALHEGRLFATSVRPAPEETGRWLTHGLGLQEIRAYDVPGLPAPATRGWTSYRGNMALTGSSR
jgi:outer membrane protein assembly factor BamB